MPKRLFPLPKSLVPDETPGKPGLEWIPNALEKRDLCFARTIYRAKCRPNRLASSHHVGAVQEAEEMQWLRAHRSSQGLRSRCFDNIPRRCLRPKKGVANSRARNPVPERIVPADLGLPRLSLLAHE